MKDDRRYLGHILESIDFIHSVTASGRAAFMSSPVVQKAVVHDFEVIGEATKMLSAELKATHPDIPWRRVAGFRDFLIHHYFEVDLDRVWQTVVQDLPQLRQAVRKALAALADRGGPTT